MADTLMTVSLTISLHQSRTGIKQYARSRSTWTLPQPAIDAVCVYSRTDSLIDVLIMYAISTGKFQASRESLIDVLLDRSSHWVSTLATHVCHLTYRIVSQDRQYVLLRASEQHCLGAELLFMNCLTGDCAPWKSYIRWC